MTSLTDCTCQWQNVNQLAHDQWLLRLSRMRAEDVAAFITEMNMQNEISVLPSELIPMVDLGDFAHAHRSLISAPALVVASELSRAVAVPGRVSDMRAAEVLG